MYLLVTEVCEDYVGKGICFAMPINHLQANVLALVNQFKEMFYDGCTNQLKH